MLHLLPLITQLLELSRSLLVKEFSSLEQRIMIHFVESGALTIQMMFISLKKAITFYLKVSMKFL
ncbi:hypothetical protein CK475_26005 [Enterobacter cloacae]|nr:hypothetical protein CK475_26005 [Enterobacter cloacae]